MKLLWNLVMTPFRSINTHLASGVAALLCASLLMLPLAGCTAKQTANTKAVIAQIVQYEPELATVVDTLSSTAATLAPGEAALITTGQATFDSAALELKALCDAYVATPNTTTLGSIRAAVDTLLATNADQFLAAAHISDPQHVAEAKLAIGGVRTVLLLIDGALQQIGLNQTKVTIAQLPLREVSPYLDHKRIEAATGVPYVVAYNYERSLGY